MRKALLAALTASVLWAGLCAGVATPTGLVRTVFGAVGEREPLHETRTHDVDLSFMTAPHMPRRFFSARWHGIWQIDRAGRYALHLGADDWARLTIDGEVLLERDSERGYGTTAIERALDAGPHVIEIQYEQQAGDAFLTAGWAPWGQPRRSFRQAALFPTAPTPTGRGINRLVTGVGGLAAALWLLVAGLLAARGVSALHARARRDPLGWRGLTRGAVAALRRRERWLSPAAALAVVLLGTALRLDGIFIMYGPFERPAWLVELEAHTRDRIETVRPDSFAWHRVESPYVGGDPVNYIRFGREMRSFYAAHVREPMFPFATKVWLALLDGQDQAVSFASATFSVLAIVATYALGRYAFSPLVGLLGALGVAVDKDLVTWGADGWRDDALMCFVIWTSLALLRVFERPTAPAAVLAGVAAAGAVLTRITALSFIVPGLLVVLAAGSGAFRTRLRAASMTLIVVAALSAPYFVNCWRVYGDPLYAVNHATGFYRARAGEVADAPMSVGDYLGHRLKRDPAGTVRIAAEGLTWYPFRTKWTGFDFWYSHLGTILAWLSAAGLLIFATTRNGAFLLVLLLASLVPYAFTWTIPGGGEWRFTMHAYPFYLLAAGLAIDALLGWRTRASCSPSTPGGPMASPGAGGLSPG